MKVGLVFDTLYPAIPVMDKDPLLFPPADPFFSKACIKRLFVAPKLQRPILTPDEMSPWFSRTWIHSSDTVIRRIFKLATTIFLLVPLWAYLYDRKHPVTEILRPRPIAITVVDKLREGVSLGELFPFLHKIPLISSVVEIPFTASQVVKGWEFVTVSLLAHKMFTWVGAKGISLAEPYPGASSKIMNGVRWLFRPIIDISLPISSILPLSATKKSSFLTTVQIVAQHTFAWVQGKEDYPFSLTERFLLATSMSSTTSEDSCLKRVLKKGISYIDTPISGVLNHFALGNIKPFPTSIWTYFLSGRYMFYSFTKITPFTWNKMTQVRDDLNYSIRGVNGYVSLWQKWVVTPYLLYGPWRLLTRPPIESLMVNKIMPKDNQKSLLERAIVRLCS